MKFEPLDKDKHPHLRADPELFAYDARQSSVVPVVPAELARLIEAVPVFFTKNAETGQFGLSALLGLSAGENLFMQDGAWRPRYLPLNLRRGPFQATGLDDRGENFRVLIDVESQAISSGSGEQLFDEQGKQTTFLGEQLSVLGELVRGEAHSAEFISSLLALDLIEPSQIRYVLDGEPVTVTGLYSINDEKLAALPTPQIETLWAAGFIRYAHIIAASRVHVGRLVEAKQAGCTNAKREPI